MVVSPDGMTYFGGNSGIKALDITYADEKYLRKYNKWEMSEYTFRTEAEFEAAKEGIPVGATVIKLYEYPDNGYSISRPDLWPVGTEIDFGHDLIGQRFTGNITGVPEGVLNSIKLFDININTFRIINQGGWFTNPGIGSVPVSIQAGTVNNDPSVVNKCWSLIQLRSGDGALFFNSYANNRSTGNFPYDVWVTYKK
jgi:hypothetical protein